MNETTTQQSPRAHTLNYIASLQRDGMEQPANGAESSSTETEIKPPENGQTALETARATPKPAVSASGNISDDEDRMPRSARDWDSFKAKARQKQTELQGELERVRNELTEAKKAAPVNGSSPEVEALKAERDELEGRLKTAAVEYHPRFQKYYEGRFNQQFELVKDVLGQESGNKLVSLLKQPDSPWRREQLEQFASSENLSTLQTSQLASIVNNLAAINRDRQSDIEKSRSTWNQLIEKEQAESVARSEAQRKQAESLFTTVLGKLQAGDGGNPYFQNRAGDEEWNGAVQKRVNDAIEILTGKRDPAQGLETFLNGLSYEPMRAENQALRAEVETLKAQVRELSTATPTLQTSGTTATATDGQATPVVHRPGASPHEVTASWMKSILQPQG